MCSERSWSLSCICMYTSLESCTSSGGFERERTTPNSAKVRQRTVNFPPDSKLQANPPHVITLRYGTSTNGLAGTLQRPTRPLPTNNEREQSHPVCRDWCRARSLSGSHWTKSALFLEPYISETLVLPQRGS